MSLYAVLAQENFPLKMMGFRPFPKARAQPVPA
jgi:hypothetical protein